MPCRCGPWVPASLAEDAWARSSAAAEEARGSEHTRGRIDGASLPLTRQPY